MGRTARFTAVPRACHRAWDRGMTEGRCVATDAGMPAPRSPVLQQGRAVRTRERVLDAAVRHFAAGGYRGTSLAAIAAEAGVTDAGLLYHFPTKQDLLFAVLQRHLDEEAEAFERLRSAGGMAAIQGLVTWGEMMERDSAFTSLHLILSAEHLQDSSPVSEFFRQRYALFHAAVVEIAERAKADGVLRPDLDTEAEATLCLSVLYGSRHPYFMTDGVSIAATLRYYVDTLLQRAGMPNG